ncbi:MAG: PHP domain-containing protein [Eubacteriales bacterium]
MKLTGDYHTHTTFSHGKSTIEENIIKAMALGLEKIVISDHGSGHFLYGVKRSRWIEMRRLVDQMRLKYPNIEILLGIEANIIGLHGDIDIRENEFEIYDIIHVGFHYGIIPKTLKDFFYLYCLNASAKIIPFLKNKAKKINTLALIRVMEQHPIFMVTHPGAKVPVDIDAVAKKAAQLDIVLEINSSHGHLTREDIVIAKKYNVKFAVNSDAHVLENIGNVSEGLKSIQYAKIPIEYVINIKEDET